MASPGNIKVVVRVRPFNNREKDRKATCIISMMDNQTLLRPPDTSKSKSFTFDKSYWSFNRLDSHYAGQDSLFRDLGKPLLDNAFQGYNNCIFAYGQTGSGKSYSMMGYGDEEGVIPRICRSMFERIEDMAKDKNLSCTVEVSYLEIYNEKVRDLLNPTTKGNLRVREHPSTGPYVEDLAKLLVRSFVEIEHLMDEGNKARTVAATNMNETSSRSHAVFTLTLTQKRHDVETNMDTEKVAKISLVDLAGSERATSTGATGARLKEGAEINRSLSTLGRVIAALSDMSTGKSKKSLQVPYRDSVLTWLLKDSLGGNSLTAMIAAISPADINYEETLSTLRYADSAKRIKNHAVVNEDPNARMIRELKEELAQLRSKLASGSVEQYGPDTPLDQQIVSFSLPDGTVKKVSKSEIQEQLSQSEKLYSDLNQTWEQKMKRTEEIHKEREQALEDLGISIEKGFVGMSTPKKMPHLVNLSDDPLLAECLVYNLKPGTTKVGNGGTSVDIRLNGSKVLLDHCSFENSDGVVTVIPQEGAAVMVNGVRINEPKRLRSGYRVILGDFHIFRFNHPQEAREEREHGSASMLRYALEHRRSYTDGSIDTPSPSPSPAPCRNQGEDWAFARREAVSNLLGNERDFEQLRDEELEVLFDDLQRVRDSRKKRPESRILEFGSDVMSLESQPEEEVVKLTASLKEMEKKMKTQKEQFERKLATLAKSGLLEVEMRRAKWALRRWKDQMCWTAMANALMENRSALKEAQMLSQQLGLGVVYQFTVVDGSPAISLYDLAQQSLLDDDAPVETAGPSIAIRVLDFGSNTISILSLQQLHTRLAQLRTLASCSPESRKHLSLAGIGGEQQYSLIGLATLPLTSILSCKVQDFVLEAYSPYTFQPIGLLRLGIEPSSVEAGKETLRFNVIMHSLKGWQERDGTHVHAQLTLTGREGRSATSLVEGFGENEVLFGSVHSQSLSLGQDDLLNGTSQNIPSNDTEGNLQIALFAKISSTHLDMLLSWDDMRDSSTPTSESAIPPTQSHIFTTVRILEIDESGAYTPVEAIRGVHSLRQGLQRRIMLSLSGESIDLTSVRRLRIGEITLSDDASNCIPTKDLVDLPLVTPPVYRQTPFGETSVKLTAQWDSAAHASPLLDRFSGRVIGLTLSWEADVYPPNGHSPCSPFAEHPSTPSNQTPHRTKFSLPLETQILPRTSTKSFTDLLFSDPKPRRTTTIARYTLSLEDEDKVSLNGWAPRGTSLISDYRAQRQQLIKRADVAKMREVWGEVEGTASGEEEGEEEVLRKCISLWRSCRHASHGVMRGHTSHVLVKRVEKGKEVLKAGVLLLLQPNTEVVGGGTGRAGAEVASAARAPSADESRPAGTAGTPIPLGKFLKFYTELRPPYLHFYSLVSGEEVHAIGLSAIKSIDSEPELGRLLPEKSRVRLWVIYGENTAWCLGSKDEGDRCAWIWAVERGLDGE
ncbi:kinesin-domain-containing protein [Piedraia hortae CBS 480.64]|uniref:Kinesin-domain-containing protein n=1 Tax=Piedraia hortae CBS 480.64 TaxID=1314780 RepID=A0A6A7C1G5_9PEZI|nr:kinesin-domain-containing protein [Piedraia hortae CBS 480.64]